MATFGLARGLSDGSRELNLYYCYCGDCDNGDDDISSGISKFVRLGCRCVLHYVCLIEYLRHKLGDRITMSLNGIACPFGSECCSFKTLDEVEGDETLIYYITTDDLDNIVAYGINHSKLQEYLDENDCKALTHEEVNDLRKWIEDEKIREIVPIDPNAITDLFVLSTTKACPHCNVRSSHPHGHQCHHISPANPPKRGGCPNCHINYCYKCLSTEIENQRDRGGASSCRCGYWSNFCIPIKSSSDIKNFISINEGGIPFDNRCGCVICSDCQFKRRCSFCPGDCCVCKGYVNPSPNEYIDASSRVKKWKAEGPALIAGGSSSHTLFDCCRHGYVAELRVMLQTITPEVLNGEDSQGRTGLFLAIDANHLECVRLLLTNEAIDVNLFDRYTMMTPLNRACVIGLIEVVRLLLTSKHINVNASCIRTGGYGRHAAASAAAIITPLYSACSSNFIDMVALLLAHKDIDVNVAHNRGFTPLLCVCYKGFAEVASLLLSHKDIDVSVKDDEGRTPLCVASYENNDSIFESLLNHKDTNINLADRVGKTPLNIVCSNKNHVNGLERVRLLLSHKDIDVNLPDRYSWTPLYNACFNVFNKHHIEIVELLLSHKDISVNVTDKQDVTPLNRACFGGNIEIVKLLLNHKDIDVNLGDVNGDTPIYNASSKGYTEIQKLLLSHPGISVSLWDCCSLGYSDILMSILQQPNTTEDDVNKKDKGGRTGLYLACHANHTECVNILLSYKNIDVNSVDNYGVTPLNNACNNGDTEVVSLLLNSKNIDVNKKDNDDSTPLYNACFNGYTEVVKLLLDHSDIQVKGVYLKIHRSKESEIGELLNNYFNKIMWYSESSHYEYTRRRPDISNNVNNDVDDDDDDDDNDDDNDDKVLEV